MIRVLIAAATPMMRAGLRALLAADDLLVAGDVAALAGRAADLADVDVVVVADDALLADVARLDIGEGRLALVALSDDERPVEALRALPLRGWGLAPPDASAAELQAVVRAAAQGLVALPPLLAERLLGQRSPQGSLAQPLAEPLTAREREVLDLVGQGLSNKLIARALQISEHTVKFHVSSIYAKLGASSRTDAVSRGARHGLITL